MVVHTFNGKLVVGNNSFDDIAWGTSSEEPSRFHFLANEIKNPASLHMEFKHILCSVNCLADSLSLGWIVLFLC